jgi:hypothetical protein
MIQNAEWWKWTTAGWTSQHVFVCMFVCVVGLCMFCMYDVCFVCMFCMHVSYVCFVCMFCMYVLNVCFVCMFCLRFACMFCMYVCMCFYVCAGFMFVWCAMRWNIWRSELCDKRSWNHDSLRASCSRRSAYLQQWVIIVIIIAYTCDVDDDDDDDVKPNNKMVS